MYASTFTDIHLSRKRYKTLSRVLLRLKCPVTLQRYKRTRMAGHQEESNRTAVCVAIRKAKEDFYGRTMLSQEKDCRRQTEDTSDNRMRSPRMRWFPKGTAPFLQKSKKKCKQKNFKKQEQVASNNDEMQARNVQGLQNAQSLRRIRRIIRLDALLFSALRLRSIFVLYEKEEGKVCLDYIKLTYQRIFLCYVKTYTKKYRLNSQKRKRQK